MGSRMGMMGLHHAPVRGFLLEGVGGLCWGPGEQDTSQPPSARLGRWLLAVLVLYV